MYWFLCCNQILCWNKNGSKTACRPFVILQFLPCRYMCTFRSYLRPSVCRHAHRHTHTRMHVYSTLKNKETPGNPFFGKCESLETISLSSLSKEEQSQRGQAKNIKEWFAKIKLHKDQKSLHVLCSAVFQEHKQRLRQCRCLVFDEMNKSTS